MSTNSTGTLLGSQEFDPWGKVRTDVAATIGAQTRINYTGQKRDDTGLLYYHARMYDPALGRFVSPDSIVPGASSGAGGAGGTVGQEENSRLTVDFHESGFLTSAAGENATTLQKGFWFQLSGEERQQARDPWGPNSPAALNRYSYVLNNPLRYTDPTGHYDYRTKFFIGEVGNGVSAKAVMDELKKNAQQYFPFKITPTNGCSAIAAGCTYVLDPGIPFSNPYTVVVTNVTDTSFTFVVTQCNSCFAPVGSTITFTTYEENGTVFLEQHSVVPDPDDWDSVGWIIQGAEAFVATHVTWPDMANRLYQHFNRGKRACGIEYPNEPCP